MCNCKPVLSSTAVALAADVFTITLQNIGTIFNGEVIRFKVVQPIDRTTPLATVSLSINGTSFPIKDKLGNDLRVAQLTQNKIYDVAVGAQTPNVIMLSCVPCSSFAYPTYAVAAVTPGA